MNSFLKKAFFIIVVATFFIFLGRGLQLVIWDAPFRAFLWDESLLKETVEGLFKTPWKEYATSSKVDANIELFTRICGITLLLSAITTVLTFTKKHNKLLSLIVYLGVFLLLLIALSEYKDKFKQLPQFFEASLQLGTPIVFILLATKKVQINSIILICKILIAITFTAHGLYALGIYNLPAHFVEMCISILKVKERTAINLLQIAGVLDIMIAFLIFVPNKKIVKIVLWYAFIWGLLTALARPFFNFIVHYNPVQSFNSIHQFLYRICHGLVPLATIYLINYHQNFSKNEIN